MGQTGIYPYGTFNSPGIDTINVGNLNVHLTVPILHRAGRGMPFDYDLSYDSMIWSPVTTNGIRSWVPTINWGWTSNKLAILGNVSTSTTETITVLKPCTKTGCVTQVLDTTTYAYSDPKGISHSFSGSTYVRSYLGLDTYGPTLTSVANDGSGYTLYAPANQVGITVTTPLGTIINDQKNEDTNGNEIMANSSGQYFDTTSSTTPVLTQAGSGTPASPVTYTYNTLTGSAAYTVNYTQYTVATKFGISGISEYGSTSNALVSSIALPDGSEYLFTYEETPGSCTPLAGTYSDNCVTGRIASVTQPTGGRITYTYSGGTNGTGIFSDGTTAGLTRTLNSDSGSAASTFTYLRTSPNGSGTSHTEVVDGLGNHKAYDFVEASNQPNNATGIYYETNRSVYQGAESGTPVIARTTCYDGATSSCSTATFTLPITQIDTYETLNGVEMHGVTAKYNAYGMQTEADVYDYGGSSSRGSLLRKEVWTYGTSIQSLVTEDDVYDGSGTLAGKTVYGYDGTTPTASSGVPQHIAVTAARGNLTSTTQYASSGTSYTSSATYEDTGSALTSTTPNGTTSLSYDSTFTYNTGAALPTPSSGVSLGASESFDTAHTGLPLTSTDPNGQITQIPSYDAMLRPTEAESPDGGITTWSYSPTTVAANTLQTSSVSSSNEIEYDGYGRQSRVETANGQSGSDFYQTDTCYDANGNASFNSYRYQSTGFSASKVCSGAGDTYSYDVLGRVTSVVRASGEGETRSYTYQGRAMKSIDENGVTRISQVDGLGRPTIVCEISSNTSMPPTGTTPVSCGTDISGTGFTTTYSYALATPTTTITQGAQTRTFVSDWLGRPTSATEPESGTTTYSYAYNSTGLVVTRTRPTANQTSSSVLTTTTTQYDSLSRPISITYSDGTPTKTFAYDVSAGANFADLTQANLKGRLSLASVPTAMTAYSYDAMGRTSSLDECLPSGCGTVANNRQLHCTYDLAGNLLTSTDGAGVTSTYTLTPANEIHSLTSSLSDSTDPATVLSNVQNGPNGPVSYTLGNGLSGAYSYDALGRLNGGAVSSNGTEVYGFINGWKGQQLTASTDTVLGQTSTFGYDEFNRLTSRTVTSGTTQNYTWVYDRYGNRWQQNALNGGSTSSLSFNTATNQISTGGYSYDAAGNMTYDGFHTYTYDAEGHITAVDNSATAQYVYNALNQRVRDIVGTTATEYVFNAAGQRVSEWNGTTRAQIKGKYYWGSQPVAYYSGGATHFEHQDWLGTERLRTTYNASVEGTFTSLPWGDGQVTSGSDGDANHYATLDHDTETNTDYAQFRQYSSAQGRWFSPDPYSGSYDVSNPQSMNRYAYVANNPVSYVDPQGLLKIDPCPSGRCNNAVGGTFSDIYNPMGDGSIWSTAINGFGWIMVPVDSSMYFVPNPNYDPDDPYSFIGTYAVQAGWMDVSFPSFGAGSNSGSSLLPYSGHSSSGAAPNNAPTVSHCLGVAGRKNGVALALDAASLGVDAFGPEAQYAKLGIGLGLSTASMINSAVNKDMTGAGLGMGSYLKAPTELAATSAGWGWAKWVPFAGAAMDVASAYHDGSQAYSDYSSCMAGH
jgi:RHS repeat-associated protein